MLLSKANKDKLLARKLKTETKFIKDWDLEVIVSEMNGKMRDDFIVLHAKRKELNYSLTGLYAAFTIVDEKGELVFTPEETSNLSGKGLDEVFEVAERLNRIFTDVNDDAKKS